MKNDTPLTFFVFSFFQILFAMAVVSSSIFADLDIGQDELNLWYGFYNENNLHMVGSNYAWICFLDFFSLLPVESNSSIFIIVFISKCIQLVILYMAYRFSERMDKLLFLQFFPLILFFSANVGRSSFDYSIVTLLAVLTLRNKPYAIFGSLLAIFFKVLISALGLLFVFVDLIQERVRRNKLLVVLFFAAVVFVFLYHAEVISYTNQMHGSMPAGRHPINPFFDEIVNIYQYALLAVILVLPPIFLSSGFYSIFFSLDILIMWLILIYNFRFIALSEILVLLIYSFFSVPFVYNSFTAARYTTAVLLFVVIRVLIRRAYTAKYGAKLCLKSAEIV